MTNFFVPTMPLEIIFYRKNKVPNIWNNVAFKILMWKTTLAFPQTIETWSSPSLSIRKSPWNILKHLFLKGWKWPNKNPREKNKTPDKNYFNPLLACWENSEKENKLILGCWALLKLGETTAVSIIIASL